MKPRVLYIASGPIRHPLIVSQVVRYLKKLSKTLEACHLVTLERDSFEEGEESKIRSQLAESGIVWHGQTSYPRRRLLNIWREIYAGYAFCGRLIEQHQLNIIHARSFIPGNIALRLASKHKHARFLYDMRGFWTAEKHAKGTIRHGLVLRQCQRMENRLYDRADALVSLSNAGMEHLRGKGVTSPISVIPCCCDTNLFRPPDVPTKENGIRKLVAAGSLGAGYLPESVFGLFSASQALYPHCTLQLVTRTDRSYLLDIAQRVDCDTTNVKIESVGPREVPRHLQSASVGVVMNAPHFDKIACSPTKLAESLACGLPVFANCRGIGDVAETILENRVGIAVEEQDKKSWESAVLQMKDLLTDKDLRERCRNLAVDRFSVGVAVAEYVKIYRRLI